MSEDMKGELEPEVTPQEIIFTSSRSSREFKIEDKQDSVDSSADPKIQLYIANAITELKDSQTANFITILGIFASFLAFLVIEIQILKTLCDFLRILGFSLFILGALFCFITFLLYFVDSHSRKTLQMIILTFVSMILIIGGVIAIVQGDDEYICKLNRLDGDFQQLQVNLQKENEQWLNDKQKEFDLLKKSILDK